jgi:hypothetical protein
MLYVVLGLFAAAIAMLMALKLVRTLEEHRSLRAGYITFGGDDHYQARDVHLDVHTAVMVARVKLEITTDAFQAVIRRVEQNYLHWYRALERAIRRRTPPRRCSDRLRS